MKVTRLTTVLVKPVLALCLCLLASGAHGLNLSAAVDRREVAANESLRLTIKADEIINDTIDVSQLSLQFNIVETAQPSSLQTMINGKTSGVTEWTLIISPKETGNLLIPSFELRGAFSPAIAIKVNPARSPQTADLNNLNVFLQASVDRTTVYVQQQVLLTLRLFYKIPLSGYKDEALKPGDATVEPLSETTYQTSFRGADFRVLQKVYAIHPQSSGRLTIPAQSWRLDKPRSPFGRQDNAYLYVRSQPISITVKAIPPTHTADHWLPATGVTLDATWESPLDQAKVGEPLNLTLTVTAQGLTGAQLPSITPEGNDLFTLYADRPDAGTAVAPTGVTGTRIGQFAVIPRRAGRVDFPEITLKWWNVATDREEIIRVSRREIQVAESALGGRLTGAEGALLSSPQADADVNGQPATGSPPAAYPPYDWPWPLLTVILAGICAILGWFAGKARARAKPVAATGEGDNAPGLLRKKAILQAIREASARRDYPALRELLLQWGRMQLNRPELGSLSAISAAYPDLDEQLRLLEKRLYGDQADDCEPDTTLLPRLLEGISKRASTSRQKPEVLEPLYRL